MRAATPSSELRQHLLPRKLQDHPYAIPYMSASDLQSVRLPVCQSSLVKRPKVRQSAPSKRCHAVHKWGGRKGQSAARLGLVRTFLDDVLAGDELAGGANDQLLHGDFWFVVVSWAERFLSTDSRKTAFSSTAIIGTGVYNVNVLVPIFFARPHMSWFNQNPLLN